MHLNMSNSSRVFAVLKKARGDKSAKMTSVLQTATGTYHDEDIFQGFAADAEYLGRSN